jgi:hypothetical protein
MMKASGEGHGEGIYLEPNGRQFLSHLVRKPRQESDWAQQPQ